MDMTFIKFCENLAERLLEAFLTGYFLIAIPDRMVRIDMYLGVFTPQVCFLGIFMKEAMPTTQFGPILHAIF